VPGAGPASTSRFLSRIGETLRDRARRRRSLGVVLIEPLASVDAGDLMMPLIPFLTAGDVVVREADERIGILLVNRSYHECRLLVSKAQSALRPVAAVSIGLRSASLEPGPSFDADTLLNQADQALAEARRCGGDLMVAWEDLIEQ
jgi:GGDEF domain-containing protein